MTKPSSTPPSAELEMRLDKWLWSARFFKTRHLAVEAINGGKVQINGQRAKPGRTIGPGAHLRIHKGTLEWEIEVLGISRQRRPASEAVQLYEENPASVQRREALTRERRDTGISPGAPGERPTKRDRRQIHRFTDIQDS